MYKEINFNNFVNEFEKMNRGEQFSREGLKELYNYLIELEDSTGDPIELDVIALCCDFSEYDNKKELLKDYNMTSIDELKNHTPVFKTKKLNIY